MSREQSSQTITVFSDYVCPFCYLGRKSLERYQATRDDELEVDWHPFDLRARKRGPDGEINDAADDGKDDEYYEQAKENVRTLQERYDVEMSLDLATDVDSLDAQVASYYVRREYPYETWLAFDRAVFDALWVDGDDVEDADVLASLAAEAGVDDADEIRSALDDDELRAEVTDLFEAAHEQGVTGVPTFAYDGYAARGAVPPEQLKRLVEGA